MVVPHHRSISYPQPLYPDHVKPAHHTPAFNSKLQCLVFNTAPHSLNKILIGGLTLNRIDESYRGLRCRDQPCRGGSAGTAGFRANYQNPKIPEPRPQSPEPRTLYHEASTLNPDTCSLNPLAGVNPEPLQTCRAKGVPVYWFRVPGSGVPDSSIWVPGFGIEGSGIPITGCCGFRETGFGFRGPISRRLETPNNISLQASVVLYSKLCGCVLEQRNIQVL